MKNTAPWQGGGIFPDDTWMQNQQVHLMRVAPQLKK